MKNNLRVCTHAENMMNKKMYCNNTTGFKGVIFERGIYKRKKPWCAQITKNRKKYRKYFSNKEDAAIAYNKMALDIHGEFARLNSI